MCEEARKLDHHTRVIVIVISNVMRGPFQVMYG